MPRYNYKCTECGTLDERTHGFNDKPEYTCPFCGGEQKKTWNAPAVQFKGSGFYSTDN